MVPTDVPSDYSERIKQLRAQLGLSPARLGELLGVALATVNQWESGELKPSIALWRRIAEGQEHGLYALLPRPEPAGLKVRETTEPYSQPAPFDFVAPDEILRHGDRRIMRELSTMKTLVDPREPRVTDMDKLFALLDRWGAEPLGDEDETVAELDRALCEDPIRFHKLDDSEWEESDE